MNRINFFRKGDRVRVTRWRGVVLGNDGYGQFNYLWGRIGTVYASNDRAVDIEFDDGQCYCLDVKCVALVQPKKRTFRQICRSLAKHSAIKGRWEADFDYAARTVLFKNDRGIMMHMYDDGEVRFEPEPVKGGYHSDIFKPAEIAAFAEACMEIAALYKAKHGKEEA